MPYMISGAPQPEARQPGAMVSTGASGGTAARLGCKGRFASGPRCIFVSVWWPVCVSSCAPTMDGVNAAAHDAMIRNVRDDLRMNVASSV
jgi:hypothetical protein